MPFKQTADRRHKFDKAQFKVTNWSDYKGQEQDLSKIVR